MSPEMSTPQRKLTKKKPKSLNRNLPKPML
jgi:hypothetical protein